jgi:hypothetical protein
MELPSETMNERAQPKGMFDGRKYAGTHRATLAFSLYLLLIGILATSLLLWLTVNGSGLSPDSLAYLTGARSIDIGYGFSMAGTPIATWPPLFSLFIAGLHTVFPSFLQAARLLNAVLFGVNAVLIAVAVRLGSRRFVAAALASGIFLASAPYYEIHAYIWSEPLFTAFTLGCVITMSLHLERGRTALLVTSAACLGFAALTRYIGVAFLPMGTIALLLAWKRPIGQRIRDALIWCITAMVPIGMWVARNAAQAGTGAGHSFRVHLMLPRDFVSHVLVTSSSFMAPISLPLTWQRGTILVLAMLITFAIAVSLRGGRSRLDWKPARIGVAATSLLFATSYLLLLYATVSFFDANVPVDMRLMSVPFILLLIAYFSIARGLTDYSRSHVTWYAFLAAATILVLAKIPDAIRSAAVIHDNGLGFTSRDWRNSETMAFMRSFTGEGIIYSNGSDILSFDTQLPSRYIPEKVSPFTLAPNEAFEGERQQMCGDIVQRGAILVYFNHIDWRWYLPTKADLEAKCNLPIWRQFADGTVYAAGARTR